jgi:glutamate dehydrogenase/leucine dehydrogenase
MKKLRKFLRTVKKDELKINIDSLSIKYTNIKHAFLKGHMNQKRNVLPPKKGGIRWQSFKEKDNLTKIGRWVKIL